MDSSTEKMIEAAVKRLAASQLSGGARAMERLRALEGRAAQNMMELQNIKTRVRDTFEYYEDGGGDDSLVSTRVGAGETKKREEGDHGEGKAKKTTTTTTTTTKGKKAGENEGKGGDSVAKQPALLSKRPSFIRARPEANKSNDFLQKHERQTITTMFEDFEKRSPVLAAMLEEVQASTRKAHNVLVSSTFFLSFFLSFVLLCSFLFCSDRGCEEAELPFIAYNTLQLDRPVLSIQESLSSALERRQPANDNVARHATDTQASFGSASSAFTEESGKLNGLSSEVMELLHAQRSRLKRAVGETAREQDRLAKAFESELSGYREEAERKNEEAVHLREKL